MIFLVLYDPRGQCQRVARVASRRVAGQFEALGFVEVDRQEFNRCALLAEEVNAGDLLRIGQAQQLLAQASVNVATRVNVEADTVRLERLRNRVEDKLQGITQAFINGEIVIETWYRQMLDAINGGNLAATVLAKGGYNNLDSVDLLEVERDNATQLSFLNRFRRVLTELSPAQSVARARSYSNSTTARYWTAHTRALGLPRLPAMPGVRTICGSNCKCNWNIIELPGLGNWNCQWRLSATESCDTCLVRQRTFDPLAVRNGVIVPFNPNGIYESNMG